MQGSIHSLNLSLKRFKPQFKEHLDICKTEKEKQMYRTDLWTLWEKARVGCFKRTASKHVYYLGWNRSLAQVGCVRQVLGPGALGRPRGIGWRGRWEGGLGWGTHVNPWLIHFNVWQNPLQYYKVISLQLIKINEKKKKIKSTWKALHFAGCWRHQGKQERYLFSLHGKLVGETLCLKTTPSCGGLGI